MNVYDTIQNLRPGDEGNAKVLWSGQDYAYKCFNNESETLTSEINAFIGGAGSFIRISDTTRSGSKTLAKYPSDSMIHGHTVTMESDASSKLTYLSGSGLGPLNASYKRRFFWEQPPTAGIKTKKTKFEAVDTTTDTAENIWKTPTKHMMMTRELNIEYKGLKDNSKKTLDIVLSYINERGKPVIIDEKTNTAGALRKDSVKEKLKKTFGLSSGNAQKLMVHLSKYNGDVGQVLEKWRAFTLVNEDGTIAISPNFNIAFETIDGNAAARALEEEEDIILWHTWPRDPADIPERLVVFTKLEYVSIQNSYKNIKSEYNNLYSVVNEEVAKYNGKIGVINDELNRYRDIVNNYNPLAKLTADTSQENINTVYREALNFYLTAAVLQECLPDSQITAEIGMPDLINVLDETSPASTDEILNASYAQIRDALITLQNVRGQLKIPASFANLKLTTSSNMENIDEPQIYTLAPVDLEKHVVFESTEPRLISAQIKNVLSDIDIFAEVRQSRAGLTSSISSKLGLKCINFIFNKTEKLAGFKRNMWQRLNAICNRLVGSKSAQNFSFITSCLPKLGIEIAYEPQINPILQGGISKQKQKSKGKKRLNHIENVLNTLSKKVETLEDKLDFISKSRVIKTRGNILSGNIELVHENNIDSVSALTKSLDSGIENVLVNGTKEEELSKYDLIENFTYKIKFEDNQVVEGVINIDKSLEFMKVFTEEVKDALEASNKISDLSKEEDIVQTIYEYLRGPMEGGARRTITINAPVRSRGRSRSRSRGRSRSRSRGRERERQRNRSRRREHSALGRENSRRSRNRNRNHGREERDRRERERREREEQEARDRRVGIHDLNTFYIDIDIDEEVDDINEDMICSSFCLLEYDLEGIVNLESTLEKYKAILNRLGTLRSSETRNGTIEEINRNIKRIYSFNQTDYTWHKMKQERWHTSDTKGQIGGTTKHQRFLKTRKNRISNTMIHK